jgi:hypothetical protein
VDPADKNKHCFVIFGKDIPWRNGGKNRNNYFGSASCKLFLFSGMKNAG